MDMIATIVVGVLAGFAGCAYLALRPPPPKVCGSPGGPLVTAPRVKLSDGRHLAYKERGIPKEVAKHKIIVSHGAGDSKDFYLPISEELLSELQIYLLSYDRAGYGESDPNPRRSVKSEAIDIQELADGLQLGPKFSVIGISMGACTVYSCLHYIPHRLAGAALVVPFVNYWWPCFPPKLARESLENRFVHYRRMFRIAHYAPWLLHWWMTQKWFPSSSNLAGNLEGFSRVDIEILKQSSKIPTDCQEKIRQQGDHESIHRDLIVGYGKWEFDPTDISNSFLDNNEILVHFWQGCEDKLIPIELSRYLSQQLPWIRYNEVPNAGHLLIYNARFCEAIFKELVSK